MSKSNRKSTASAKHRQPAASAKEVTKISVSAAGSQRADHAGSGGRCAGARAGFPLNALPVEAQNIVRAGVLAFVLGVGAVVANTPAVACAAPDDTSSSGSSSTSSSSSESAASTSSTDPASSTASPASAADSSSGSTSEEVQSSVDSQPVRPPHHVTLRRQTHALGLCRVRVARTPALPRRAATPPHQLRRRPPQPGRPLPAPQGDSHGAPNSAGSTLTNRSGSVSATSATQESTVVVRAAATSASTAEPPTATAAVESVAAISSAVEGAPETQAVAQPFSDPSAPPNPVTDVVSKVLASVGLNPFASDSPVAPIDSP